MRQRLLAGLGALLLAASAGAEPRTVKLTFPRFEVPPGASVEACRFVRLPATEPLDLSGWEIRNRGAGGAFATLHFIVYQYTGERLGEWAAAETVLSRGCLDVGPADRAARQIVGLGFRPVVRGALPAGVALRLAPVPDAPGGAPAGIGILLSANWSNETARPQTAQAKVLFRRARPGSVRRVARLVAADAAERALAVPPGAIVSTETTTAALAPGTRDVWQPPVDACVTSITGRFHKRTRLFAVDALDTAGAPANPANGPTNGFEPGRRHLFVGLDYTDPGVLTLAPSRLVRTSEALHWACWTDNGLGTAVRMGCEESAGVPPGIAAGLPGAGAAKPCRVGGLDAADCPASDPGYPGRSFTGACVAANAVAGPSPDDEACALTAVWYEAAPGPTCDLSGLPALPSGR